MAGQDGRGTIASVRAEALNADGAELEVPYPLHLAHPIHNLPFSQVAFGMLGDTVYGVLHTYMADDFRCTQRTLTEQAKTFNFVRRLYVPYQLKIHHGC
ncbi:hypothetical protein BDBG_02026 [Blastomyces gilchristii SLH14081]|uniref:Uncharacterized protein n=1 Tax=Blastomyces gilchristii (strain SLH14081) TaxID=559298 RepID=A0A179UEH2_BLAGS|nr:uncharacterized protein BDBG_02026 [Blastomyces gilchristii SLH14081]OAT05669.1 hypothetical protein BDBG_02026 [Blastomyces gilchristii SLH14081]